MDALVIIDVQMGMFTTPGYTPHEGEATVARIAGLLKRARSAGTPVFFVQHDGGKGDPLEEGTHRASISGRNLRRSPAKASPSNATAAPSSRRISIRRSSARISII